MRFSNILNQLQFWRECKRVGLSFWQCPNTLVLIMGSLSVTIIGITYFIASKEHKPEVVIFSVAIASIFITAVSFLIVRTFEELATANMLKTDFVNITSHQLRAPLSAMHWTLNLLMGPRLGKLSPKQQTFLGVLGESNQRMIRLVNDLLNVSRIDQGRLPVKVNKIELVGLARAVLDEMKSYAEANNAKLVAKVPKGQVFVSGDDFYVRMVIGNLVDNAIRYNRGQSTIEIEVRSREDDARLSVSDHGVGIPRREQRRVFEKFFRSSNVLRQQTVGTGLGLFIAHAVIMSMKGRIGFSSKENVGSTFWFELKRV